MSGPATHRRRLAAVLGLAISVVGCGGSVQLRYGDTNLRVARGANGKVLLGTAPGAGERVATVPSGDVILTGSSGQGSFIARVSSVGETKWKHALAHCGYSIDVVAPDDATIYVAAAGLAWVGDVPSGVDQDCSRFSVVRLDGSGHERWRFADRGWSNKAPLLSASSTTVVAAAAGPEGSSLLVGIDATAGRAAWTQRFEDLSDALRPAQNARVVFSATNPARLPDPRNCVVRATEPTHGEIVWEKTVSIAGQRCSVVRMWATDAELIVYGVSSSAATSETHFLSVLDANSGERRRHHERLDFDRALQARHDGVPTLKTGEVVVEVGVDEKLELLALDPRSGQARWLSELRSLDDRRRMLRINDLATGPDAVWVTGYFAGRIGSDDVTLRAAPDIHHPHVDMQPASDQPVWPLFLFRQPIVRTDR